MSENFENVKKGGISVDTEHIFPIIKKWLYSEKDIFLREIVSNATDAITKLKRLDSLGQIKLDENDFRINVIIDKDAGTLTVEDNGIGMSEEELKKYICQIALSGAFEFIQKYENESDASAPGIIGHFGLGFYSAFMVSNKVEIITKSYTDAPAIRWVCEESGEYEISASEKGSRGTAVIMHIADEEVEYLQAAKIKDILEKFCSFMPVEIYFSDASEEKSADEQPKPVNDIQPLWQKRPSDCSDEDYNSFYKKVFRDYKDPLFHIHINADYPLNFKGILYFPKLSNEYESLEGQVKLYYNQVFVADNIKEVIPEYLLMLKGVLDCPELPLNVSRSYLQTNTYVAKVSAHIVKKVADKLNALCNTEREKYEKVWNDIRTFVEYACMRDQKFYERVKDSILLKLTDNSYLKLDDYLAKAKETHENIVYYATDTALQAQYITMFKNQGLDVAVFEHAIDTQFISVLEQYTKNVKFVRIDSDIASSLKSEDEVKEDPTIKELFVSASGNDSLKVVFESLKDSRVPAILTVSEEARRFDDMMKMYSMADSGFSSPASNLESTLVVNVNSPLIKHISEINSNDSDKAASMAKYIYKLATLSQRKLSSTEMQDFLNDSFDILELL